MLTPGRTYSATSSYRYGFNGKENDNEVRGEGNGQDYGFRIYDPRLGRFLSVDPLSKNFQFLTPYQFSGNTPIRFVDLDGLEQVDALIGLEKLIFGTNHIEKIEKGFVERATNTVKGIFSGKAVPESLKKVILGPNRLATTDPNVAKVYTNNLRQASTDVAKMGENAIKGMINDYVDLFKRAAKGDDNAIGALGFEIALFAIPGGEEGKAVTAIPKGFKNAEQFAQVGKELAEALEKSGLKYEEIGVRGSSVTGKSVKGGGFRETPQNGLPASDIDAYVVLEEDVWINGSTTNPQFIHPDKMMKNYPALKAWSEKWSGILGREITPAAFKPKPGPKTP